MRVIRTVLTLVHHGETLVPFKLFAQLMDRAKAFHTPRYDISGSWKSTPGENKLVLSSENLTFQPEFYTCLAIYLPLNTPAATKKIILQEDKPFLRFKYYTLFTAGDLSNLQPAVNRQPGSRQVDS